MARHKEKKEHFCHPLVKVLFETIDAKGMTWKEFEARSGIAISTLQYWRAGREMKFTLLAAACEAVGIDITWEIKGDEDERTTKS